MTQALRISVMLVVPAAINALVMVSVLTVIPARLGTRRSTAQILQAELG